MLKKLILNLSLAAVLLFPLSLYAEYYDEAYDEYGRDNFRISGHIGYNILVQEPLSNTYKDNLIYGIELGYKIHKNIEFAAALDLFTTSCDCPFNPLDDLSFTKMRYGVYYHINPGGVNPRIGAGLDYSWAKFELAKGQKVDDGGLGFYVSAGLEIPVAPSILVGFEGIYSMVEIDYDNTNYSGNSGYGGNGNYYAGDNPEISGFSLVGFLKIHF